MQGTSGTDNCQQGGLLVSPGDPQADSPGPHFTELCQVAWGRESPQGGHTHSRLGELA